MSRRSYDQFCGLAVALDRVGERWTLLIVRELLAAPARYRELAEALPGLATNLLTRRLRSLEAHGLLRRRRLPSPADVTVYELTETGRDLEPAVLELMRWGARWMPKTPYREPETVRGVVIGLRAILVPEAVQGLRTRVEIRLDLGSLGIELDFGAVQVGFGELQSPEAILEMTYRTLTDVMGGRTSLYDARESGAASVVGQSSSVDVLDRALRRSREILAA